MVGDARAWRLPPSVNLLRRTWDDESVVYSDASGETHILDAFSDWILSELEQGSVSVADLLARCVEPDESPEERMKIEARIETTLAFFDSEGLAEPLPA